MLGHLLAEPGDGTPRDSGGPGSPGSLPSRPAAGSPSHDGAELSRTQRDHPNPFRDRNILIIDDRTLYREALSVTLRSHGIAGVRTAWDLSSVIAVIDAAQPSVILLNTATRGVKEVLQVVMRLAPHAPVIAIAVSEYDEAAVVACAEAGVAGYHMRMESLPDLLVLINDVAEGRIGYPPAIAAMLLRRMSTGAADRGPTPKEPVLTGREIQILRMLEQGRSNQDIAAQLHIAVHTVKNHVHNLLTKLDVRTRAEAAALSRTMQIGRDAHGRTSSGTSQSWLR